MTDAPLPIVVPPLRLHRGPFEPALLALAARNGWGRLAVLAGPRTAAATELDRRFTGPGGPVVRRWTTLVAHAPTGAVEALAAEVAAFEPDVLVSVGGGSAHDSAKGVAVLLALGGRLTDHCLTFTPPDDLRHQELPGSKVPIVTVPSTLAGSEANGAAGFSIDGLGRKRVLADPSLFPEAVLVDRAVLASTPAPIFLGSAMNALNHCVEGLASRRRTVVSEALLTKAMAELAAATELAGGHPVDRERASVASALAGIGLTGSWLGLAHAIGHVLGARYRVPHGWCHAVLAGPAIRFNAPVAGAEHAALASALGVGGGSEDLARWMEDRATRFGLPRTLAELGVAPADLPAIAASAWHDHDSFYNPRRPSVDDIQEVLAGAL